MPRQLETDYLIIGAGAMGMAFADEVVTQSRDARIILVDRRAKPGGHWNDAYPFVTLHQPALYYGVNSEPLGPGGAYLATRAEILAYYERVLDKLCATGRVTFFPQCDYMGGGQLRSTVVENLVTSVTIRRKTVDASYSKMEVPSTHPPRYAVAPGVSLVPINALARIDRPWSRYVVIGAGKTGMDALLFLLGRGVDPDCITWIVSNDAWFINRRGAQPASMPIDMPEQLRRVSKVADTDEVFRIYEAEGWMFRLDKDIWPTKFRCATITADELLALQRISDVVRKGRVTGIEPTQIVLDRGTVPTHAGVLHIDCTADGLVRRPARPVFEGDRITLQPLAMCQQVFSSALIGLMEVRYDDDASKNKLAKPVPHPELPLDLFRCSIDTLENAKSWFWGLGWWLLHNRLSVVYHISVFGRLRMLLGLIRWGNSAVKNLERVHQELHAQVGRSGGDAASDD